MSTNHFIVIYNAAEHRLVDLESFSGVGNAALKRLSELEKQYFGDEAVQVILFGAESLDTLKVTHPHYFYGMDALHSAA